MSRLPPVEKFPLALRKNVRDEWDNNKADIEGQLSELLGESWTLEANPNAIWPYHNNGYAKQSLGSCIKAYFEGALYQIKNFVNRHGDGVKNEINTICSAHVMVMDVEEVTPKRFTYCGCDVQAGKLRVLFQPDYLGTNIDYALEEQLLVPALNNVPGSAPLSLRVRLGIRRDYNPAIERCRKEIAEATGNAEFKLNADFEDAFAKLEAASKETGSNLGEDWQDRLGSFTLNYFEALAYHLKSLKLAEDEMIRDGFNEVVKKGEATFRIVDSLKYGSYCESEIDDGILYLQTVPQKWGTNVDNVAEMLMDLL